jgi:O-acetyl-ADP-ribose deacetylase (regulator of RNase III)
MRLEVLVGDITVLDRDAIVNAANSSLLGGGGVDGAIHRAAGPELVQRCRLLGGCKVGEARVTPGFRLPAKWIIHTVGPKWRGGESGEALALASCYVQSLARADEVGARSVAFPAIATGIYGYPAAAAAAVAVDAVRAANTQVQEVTFVCFDDAARDAYVAVLGSVQGRELQDADLAAVFEPEPARWGLRGDPHVWHAMRDRLRGVRPTTAADAHELLHSAFEEIVGVSLNDDGLPGQVHRPELDHGGMSGGHVHIETWRTTLMPLLVSRAASYR